MATWTRRPVAAAARAAAPRRWPRRSSSPPPSAPTRSRCARRGDRIAITWREYAERVERIAAGLAALGVERGDAVALMLLNRPEFHLVDTAALHLGAVAVLDLQHVAARAGRAPVSPTPATASWSPSGTSCPSAARGSAGSSTSSRRRRRDQSRRSPSSRQPASSSFRLRRDLARGRPDDIATLIYTSGTTGPPKGVELTHANVMAECAAVGERCPSSPGGRTMSFLPSAHIADRWCGHYSGSITFGCTLTSVGDLRTVIPAAGACGRRAGAPSRASGRSSRPRSQARASPTRRRCREEGAADSARARPRRGRAPRRRRGADADRVAALLRRARAARSRRLWGMSETACCVTVNPPGAIRLGTCGTPMPGVERRARRRRRAAGPRPDGDARLPPRAGDDGRGDRRRRLAAHRRHRARSTTTATCSIVDRKKELIINAAGKNMLAGEHRVAAEGGAPLIGHAVAIGDRRRYVAALIVLDPDAAPTSRPQHGIDDASAHGARHAPEVRRRCGTRSRRANARLSRVERSSASRSCRRVAPGGDELTPTMKLKRRADRDALRGRDRRALPVGVAGASRPARPGEVVGALGAVAVDDGAGRS